VIHGKYRVVLADRVAFICIIRHNNDEVPNTADRMTPAFYARVVFTVAILAAAAAAAAAEREGTVVDSSHTKLKQHLNGRMFVV